MKAAHDDEGAEFLGYAGKAFGLVVGACHAGDGNHLDRGFFEEGTHAVENPGVVVIFGHDEGFDIVLDGGGQITDADAVGNESGEWGDDGLGCFNETDVIEICHNLLS